MAKLTTQKSVSYLNQVEEFLRGQWPRVKKALRELAPPDFGRASREIQGLDTEQESKKGGSKPISAALAATMDRALEIAGGAIEMVRGHLRSTGQPDRLAEAPRAPGGSFESQIAYLKQAAAFLAAFKEIAGRQAAELGGLIAKATEMKSRVQSAVRGTKPTTTALKSLEGRETTIAATWVRLVETVAELAGLEEVRSAAPRQGRARRTAGRKPLPTPATP